MKLIRFAQSISRPVCKLFAQQPFEARVFAVFDHACDLVTPDSDVIALVSPQIGNGPLNIVLEMKSHEFLSLSPGTTANLGNLQHCHSGLGTDKESLSNEAEAPRRSTDRGSSLSHLRIGDLALRLDEATVWEPCPDWETLRTRQVIISSNLSLLRAIALRRAPAASLLNLTRTQTSANGALATTVRQAAETCRAGWDGDMAKLCKGAAQLAGLGTGLTPSGDDSLVGMMLWAWLAHPAPAAFCRAVVETAAPRTTTLSAAFLRSTAKGECSAAWHQLLAALATDSRDNLDAATEQVLAHGATSGADTLAGFLWMSLRNI